jgi:hypothetical protein
VTEDVYLVALHEPYEDPGHPVPLNGFIVHARTLLHSSVPQPDGGLMYRCLTEFPGRTPGCLVPLSTLTFELGGGYFWPEIGDWATIVNAVLEVIRRGECSALQLNLPQLIASMLAMGPGSSINPLYPDGHTESFGPSDRQIEPDKLSSQLHDVRAAEGELWSGAPLVEPPGSPRQLPYHPAYSTPPS